MRHRYETHGIILARSPAGETSAALAILTSDIGLVRARAQNVRASGAKLAAALTTFAESDLLLVRGREQWRVAGAVLREQWFVRLAQPDARARATRMVGLLLRLVTGETNDVALFPICQGFFAALATLPEEVHASVELLAALRLLAALGFDAGTLPSDGADFSPVPLATIAHARTHYIARVNRGIAASGL